MMMMMAGAAVVGGVEVAARGGEWSSGSNRSGGGDAFGTRPEKLAGKVFPAATNDGCGGRWLSDTREREKGG
ncbi:hypothetical protein Tco_0609632, partial [Tanacetum coccineum]